MSSLSLGNCVFTIRLALDPVKQYMYSTMYANLKEKKEQNSRYVQAQRSMPSNAQGNGG